MREKPELHTAVQPHPRLPHRGRPRYPPRITHNPTRLGPATPNTATTTVVSPFSFFPTRTPCYATNSPVIFSRKQDAVSCGIMLRQGLRGLAASEEGEEVGLRKARHGFGEEVHDHHRGVREVDVSKVAVDNGHLFRREKQKRAAGRRKQDGSVGSPL